MTINRRALLAGLTAAAAVGASRLASAQSWREQYPELVYAVVPAENATGVTDRYTPFVDYLGRELGTKVTLRVANDYAAVIEGQRAGNIHIGYYGPASFSRARLTGVATDAFVIDVNSDGSKGYYSVFYVLAKRPYRQIEELKGAHCNRRRGGDQSGDGPSDHLATMERQHGVAESEKDRPNQKRSCPAQRSIARTAGERRRNAAEQAAQAKGADARGMTARRVVPLAPVPLGADQKTDRQGNAQPADKVDSIDALIGHRNILPLSA
jgi:hypothetical protein